MALMIIGCSSGPDTVKTMAQDNTAGGDIKLHECTPAEQYAIIEQANKEAPGFFSYHGERMASGAVSGGLSWIPGIGSLLASANNARQETKEWTQSSSRKSIDVIAGAKCDEQGNYVPSDTANKLDKINAIANPLR
jgi:hypothetical protein